MQEIKFRCEYYDKDNRNIGYDDTYAIKVNMEKH